MKIGLTLLVGLFTAFGLVSVSRAGQPVFEIRAEIQGPAGQDWGRHALTASQGNSASTRFSRDGDTFKLGATLSKGSRPGCQLLGIRLEQTVAVGAGAPREKDLRLQTEACTGRAVSFDGAPLGGPKIKIVLAKVRR